MKCIRCNGRGTWVESADGMSPLRNVFNAMPIDENGEIAPINSFGRKPVSYKFICGDCDGTGAVPDPQEDPIEWLGEVIGTLFPFTR